MPGKSRGKKFSNQRRPVEKAPVVASGVPEPVEANTTVAAVTPTIVKQATRPVSSTPPAPRHFYVGRELLRVAVVSVIALGLLVVLAIFWR